MVCLAEGTGDAGSNCVHVMHYAPVSSEKASVLRRLQLFSSPLSPHNRALIFSQAARPAPPSRKTSVPARPHGFQQLSAEKLASASSTSNVNSVSAWIAELPGESSATGTASVSAGEPVALGVANVAFAQPVDLNGDDAQLAVDASSNPMRKKSNALRLGAPSVTIHPPTPSTERAPSLLETAAAAADTKVSSPTAVSSPPSEKDSVEAAFRSEPTLAESEVVTPDSGEQSPSENKE